MYRKRPLLNACFIVSMTYSAPEFASDLWNSSSKRTNKVKNIKVIPISQPLMFALGS